MKYLETKKDKRKFIRGIIQALFLIFVVSLLINSFINFKKYEAYEIQSDTQQDKGFVALSYFAVDREGDENMISVDRLDKHLDALKQNGYQTISQKDLANYYKGNLNFSDKSLFLFFEDGRRDTTIFASPLLEKYNYMATTLNYAQNLVDKDPKFLSGKDLKRLDKQTFWEQGSNGYRLSYINVFDMYENFLGQLTSDEFNRLRQYIKRDYDHYLMDFIRDDYRIPIESYEEMEQRIIDDYDLMHNIYTKELGYIPSLYVLMHSNTDQFGTNDKTSDINETLIKGMFAMNFNREGYAYNNKESSIYDLTRMQPQPNWYANHLLMRLQDDTNDDIIFIEGDKKVKEDWTQIEGVSEYSKSDIILTTQSKDKSLIRLNEALTTDKYSFEVLLKGNVIGSQKIYLNSDKDLNNYLAVELINNKINIIEDDKEIFTLDLNDHDAIDFQSTEEHKLETSENEYKLYKKNIKKRKNPTKMELQSEVVMQDVPSIEDGDTPYIPDLQLKDIGERKLKINIDGNSLTLIVDEKVAIEDLKIQDQASSYIHLESTWVESGYSQRNIYDDVYDGVFEDILIMNADETTIYKNKLEGFALFKDRVNTKWNQIISWFIKNL